MLKKVSYLLTKEVKGHQKPIKDLIYRKKHLFKLSNYVFILTIMPHAKIRLFNFKHFNYH